MITLKYQFKQVDVNKGVAKNWKRAFDNDIRVPDGWMSSIEVDGRMVELSFVRVAGAKMPAGEYVLVKASGTREQALGDTPAFLNAEYFIVHMLCGLKPDDLDNSRNVWQYLKEVSLAYFTTAQREQWVKEKKLKVS